jgi:hypothetical protein
MCLFERRDRYVCYKTSVVENVFDRNQRREAEINEALKQEAVRHAAVVKNMHRLRALRLAREEKSKEQPLTKTTVHRQQQAAG